MGKGRRMEAYTSFAEVYDAFMDNIPYEQWSAYMIALLKEYHIENGLVCELGCGTGTLTRQLAQAGYDMIGIDSSLEMLSIAESVQADTNILYLMQDMRTFELYGTVAAIVSVCDCINYITDPKELSDVFRLVNNYLDPGGIFLFDFHPEHYYSSTLGDQTFAEDREDMSFIWENEYDKDSRINIYDLSFFIRAEDGRYDKFQETHYQRAYTLHEMQHYVAASGLRLLAAYDACTRRPASENSERIFIVACECQKERKK